MAYLEKISQVVVSIKVWIDAHASRGRMTGTDVVRDYSPSGPQWASRVEYLRGGTQEVTYLLRAGQESRSVGRLVPFSLFRYFTAGG